VTSLPSPFLLGTLTGLFALVVSLFAAPGFITQETQFSIITILLTGYLMAESWRVRTVQHDRWLANPAVLCSLFTFFLPFCMANFLSIIPVRLILLQEYAPVISPATNKTMLLVLTGAIAMWIGYWSTSAERFVNRLNQSRLLVRILRPGFDPHTYVLFFCVVASLTSRLISIRLGVFGYSSDALRLTETASIRQYLDLTEALGKFGLILASLKYFSPGGKTRHATLWLLGLLIYEVTAGFMSGFKSQVAMPFIIVGICQYLRTSVMPWRFISLVPVALLAAYLVIEPFRYARSENTTLNFRSVGAIAGTMARSIGSGESAISIKSEDVQTVVGLAVLRSVSLTEVAARGVEYADQGHLGQGAPEFLRSIFLAPLYAVVPRFLWSSKETTYHGKWYSSEVMGEPEDINAVGMSPFIYLYFAGGGLAIAVGFFCVGIIQRMLYDGLLRNRARGALVVYLVTLQTVVLIDSIFFTLIVNLIRLFPIALAIQYLSLKGPGRFKEDPDGSPVGMTNG